MRTQDDPSSLQPPSSRWEHALPRLAGMSLPLLRERTSFPEDKYPVVDLAHFAAIGGLTRREYLVRMIAALREGRPGDVLRPEAMKDLMSTMAGKQSFVLCIQMSLNKPVESCFYCTCETNGKSFSVDKIVPGLVGLKPRSMADRTFEVAFCDLRMVL